MAKAQLITPIGSGSFAAGAPHATLVVAASNASAKVRATADYVCDGTADEVQINAAITALPAGYTENGGIVQLTQGLYTIAAPIQFGGRDIALLGAGNRGSTKIILANGANCNMVETTGSTNYHHRIAYIWFEGNKGNQTGGDAGLYFNNSYPVIDHVYVMRHYGAGLYLSCSDTVCTNVYSEFNRGFGWDITSGQNMQIIACTAWANEDTGMWVKGSRGTIIACRVMHNNYPTAYRNEGGVNFYDAKRWQMIGGYVQKNATNGISIINCEDITLEGVIVRDNGITKNANDDSCNGILLSGTSKHCSVTGCAVYSYEYTLNDDDYIVTSASLSSATPITFSLANSSVRLTGKRLAVTMTHVNITAFTLTLNGSYPTGQAAALTFTEANVVVDGANWLLYTPFSLSSVSSVILTARTGTGVDDTLIVGENQPRTKNGIHDLGTADYNLIVGNRIWGHDTAQQAANAANNVSANNMVA